MAFDKKNKKGRMPFEAMADEDGETPFDMQARGGGKPPMMPKGKPPMMPKGKPSKGGGFMQALKNAKKKAPKKKGK